MQGYAVYHEMDYAGRHFERGEYAELEIGVQKNDLALLSIGYLKEHDGENLLSCLRCGKRFVNNTDSLFLRKHEETCPMTEITVPSEIVSSNDEHEEIPVSSSSMPKSLAELSQMATAAREPQGEK